jgi:L-ascorbate metabolism protein UlaG (beta-lactamase superfamily)
MEIKWFGHSCFRLKGRRTSIITDPISTSFGYITSKLTADIVTISHNHPGHNNIKSISGKFRLIKGPGEYEIGDAIIIGISTSHDSHKSANKGRNTIYVIELDELAICHLGDLGQPLNDTQIEELGEVDILLLPVGGISTINAIQAAQVVRKVEPRVVIPMHYATDCYTHNIEPVDNFLKEMGVTKSESLPKLNINKSNLPLSTSVFILEY